jgi:hypothetical protein
LPQALSAFRLLKVLGEVELGEPEREPEPEPEPEPVVPEVRALVVLRGLVVPVPVLVVRVLLLAVPVARPAAIRLAIQARGQTAGGRRGRPDLQASDRLCGTGRVSLRPGVRA